MTCFPFFLPSFIYHISPPFSPVSSSCYACLPSLALSSPYFLSVLTFLPSLPFSSFFFPSIPYSSFAFGTPPFHPFSTIFALFSFLHFSFELCLPSLILFFLFFSFITSRESKQKKTCQGEAKEYVTNPLSLFSCPSYYLLSSLS